MTEERNSVDIYPVNPDGTALMRITNFSGGWLRGSRIGLVARILSVMAGLLDEDRERIRTVARINPPHRYVASHSHETVAGQLSRIYGPSAYATSASLSMA